MCKEFTDVDLSVVENVFRCNILQMFAVTKYALPHMTKGDSYAWTTKTIPIHSTRLISMF
jgi:short-subunit dehydrogenase